MGTLLDLGSKGNLGACHLAVLSAISASEKAVTGTQAPGLHRIAGCLRMHDDVLVGRQLLTIGTGAEPAYVQRTVVLLRRHIERQHVVLGKDRIRIGYSLEIRLEALEISPDKQ